MSHPDVSKIEPSKGLFNPDSKEFEKLLKAMRDNPVKMPYIHVRPVPGEPGKFFLMEKQRDESGRK